MSVVIPCFNAGRWLAPALDSLRAQTHEDREIIVVDDGSDEQETLAILGALCEPRCRVVSQENRGLAAARNRGVREAAGAFVQFLDAVDLIVPT